MENENVNAVYSIFKDFFGEERVDLQKNLDSDEMEIIIYFPKVTVTNEYDKSINITQLWVKVHISEHGTIIGVFEMLRSEYTMAQLVSGYSHSHINTRDQYNIKRWGKPCLGSGPIRNTIISLTENFNKEIWELFCYELSKYVTVESISGVPYIRLENVGLPKGGIVELPFTSDNIDLDCTVDSYGEIYPIIKNFISYIIEKRPFNFNFINGSYGIAMTDKEKLITLSNLFIEYYNSLPSHDKCTINNDTLFAFILCKGKFINGYLYYTNDSPFNENTSTMLSYEGTELLKFKGKSIKLHIIKQLNENDPNIIIFLNPKIAKVIINRILILINSEYGKPADASIKKVRKFI